MVTDGQISNRKQLLQWFIVVAPWNRVTKIRRPITAATLHEETFVCITGARFKLNFKDSL